jgi:hypothetical protein
LCSNSLASLLLDNVLTRGKKFLQMRHVEVCGLPLAGRWRRAENLVTLGA